MWHGQSVYGEMVHVPLVVRWPAGCRPERTVDEPVQLIDVMPTLLDFSRLDAPAGHAGPEPGAAARRSAAGPGRATAANGWKRRPVIMEKLPLDGHGASRRTLEAVRHHRRRLEADSQQGPPARTARVRAVRRDSATRSISRTSRPSIPSREAAREGARRLAHDGVAARLKPDAEATKSLSAGAAAAAPQPRVRQSRLSDRTAHDDVTSRWSSRHGTRSRSLLLAASSLFGGLRRGSSRSARSRDAGRAAGRLCSSRNVVSGGSTDAAASIPEDRVAVRRRRRHAAAANIPGHADGRPDRASPALTIRDGRLTGRSTTDFPVVHFERTTGFDNPDLVHAVEIRMRASGRRQRLGSAASATESVDLARTDQHGRADFRGRSRRR